MKKYKVKQIIDSIRSKEISAEEITTFYLNEIQNSNKDINAFISINEKALTHAKEVDRKIANGERIGKLAGVPIAIKDNICTAGLKTTAASKMLLDFVPDYNATLVEKLISEDAIIIGKTNMDEFAMGSSNETSFFGTVNNPHNLEYVAGGSSGGSAAAVAAGLVPAAIGTDTGGSIRQPAAFCGVVGMKPTYGLVSRFGLIAFASSLDQAGCFAANVEDLKIVLDVISGDDSKDSTSVAIEMKNSPGNSEYKVGVIKEFMEEGLNDSFTEKFNEIIKILNSKNISTNNINLKNIKLSIPTYYVIATSEASSNLSRYDGVRYGHRAEANTLKDLYRKSRSEGFGEEVKRRIILGTYTLSSGYFDQYYNQARKVRALITQDFEQAFESCDFLITPVVIGTAFKTGEKINDPMSMYLNDLFTTSANLAGIPGISIPIGRCKKNNMPLGLQILSKKFNDLELLKFAKFIETQMEEMCGGLDE